MYHRKSCIYKYFFKFVLFPCALRNNGHRIEFSNNRTLPRATFQYRLSQKYLCRKRSEPNKNGTVLGFTTVANPLLQFPYLSFL